MVDIKAVIFDLGGVVLDSPMEILADVEKNHGLEPNFINRLIVGSGPQGAWARLERGEIPMEDFFDAFDREIQSAGADISSREIMGAINNYLRVRPEMLDVIRQIRKSGILTAALTNNWVADDEISSLLSDFKKEFDVFVESSREGLAKPDPRIYKRVLEKLGVAPEEAVFLDDIGRNLKPARKMGMITIKVVSVKDALAQLKTMLHM
jgi:epoxide hydrolase-like predicted phosphatase